MMTRLTFGLLNIGTSAALVTAGCGSDGGTGPPPGSRLRFTQLSAGYYHTCGLATDGAAFCWGANGFGTLGDGTREPRLAATAVAGGLSFQTLDAGAGHNCALTKAGAAWCWGQNDEGQLGDASSVPRDRPVAVSGNRAFVQISAGHAHSCGLTGDGIAYCWGDDSRGQLGDGTDEPAKSTVPVRVLHAQPFIRVEAGYYQSCALAVAGEMYCWGLNDSGQLGDGSRVDRNVPVLVGGRHYFSALAPGDRFVCGLSGGAAWCWGANRNGELGAAAPDTGASIPIRVADGAASLATSMGASTVGSAEAYGCLLAAGGAASCWGGAIRALRPRGATPTAIDNQLRFQSLVAGAQHLCGLTLEGYAYCGGANYAGQLGDETQMDRTSLVTVH